METHTISAKNKKMGRLATEVAVLLMGKNTPAYRRNLVANVSVVVTDASQMDISLKKRKNETYIRYSGYPGGIKTATLEEVITKKGIGAAFKKSVYGMLPVNKLRSKMIKNLTVIE